MAKDAKNQAHPANLSQVEKFRELARAVGVDEDEEAFKAKVVKVAHAPRPAPKPKD